MIRTIMRATLAGVATLAVASSTTIARGGQARAPERFTVMSDGHPMAVWSRRPSSPKGSVLLVHGRTWSSRPDFDLQVPGLQRSVMASLSAQGFATYAVDLRGYGETPRDETGWLTPNRSVADIVNVLVWVAARHPSLPKPTLIGWSRGAIMAGMAAQNAPAQVSNLVMFGFAFDPDLRFADLDVSGDPLRMTSTRSMAEADFVSPDVTPKAVIEAFVEQALRSDPVVVDVKNDDEFNRFLPVRVKTPTLVMFGSADPGVSAEDAGKMFARLLTDDKQLVSLPGGDHAALIEDTHDAWIAAIVNFINRPPARR